MTRRDILYAYLTATVAYGVALGIATKESPPVILAMGLVAPVAVPASWTYWGATAAFEK